MWPEWVDAAMTSPLGWLQIPALFVVAVCVAGAVEQVQAWLERRRANAEAWREAREQVARMNHPSSGRRPR